MSIAVSNVEPSGFFAETNVPQFQKPIVDGPMPTLTCWPAVPLKVSFPFWPTRENDRLTAAPSMLIASSTSDESVMVMLPVKAFRGSTKIAYVPVLGSDSVLLPVPSVPMSIVVSSVEPSGFLAETNVPQFQKPIVDGPMPTLTCWPAVPLKVSFPFWPTRENDRLTAAPSMLIASSTSDESVMVMLPVKAFRGSTKIAYVPVLGSDSVLLPVPSVPMSIVVSSVEPS